MAYKYSVFDKNGQFETYTDSEEVAKFYKDYWGSKYLTNLKAPHKDKVVSTYTGKDKYYDEPNLHWGYSSDILHKPLTKRSRVKETAIMKDINNVRKRRS